MSPAERIEFIFQMHIPDFVCRNFLGPKFGPSLRQFEISAIMSMPETAIHKNYRSVLRENQVRLSGQLPVMQPEPKTQTVQATANNHFGFGIF
jgi:hypothetical protein